MTLIRPMTSLTSYLSCYVTLLGYTEEIYSRLKEMREIKDIKEERDEEPEILKMVLIHLSRLKVLL